MGGSQKVESTKIGVKTCKKICEDMGGTFKAMEEEKVYTTEILFPIVESDEPEEESETEQKVTVINDTETVAPDKEG